MLSRPDVALGTLLGIAGLVVGFAGLNEELLKDFPLLFEHRAFLLTLGVIVTIGSAIILVIALGQAALAIADRALDLMLGREKAAKRFVSTDVSLEQLRLVYDFVVRILQGQRASSRLTSFEDFTAVWRHYPRVYKVIWNNHDVTMPTVVGLIAAYPLTKSAAQEMLAGRLRGHLIQPSHILARGKAKTVYIGAIAAAGKPGSAQLLRVIDLYLGTLTAEGDVPQFLTTPQSGPGIRIAGKYGFTPVLDYPGGGSLWMRLPSSPLPRRHKPVKSADLPPLDPVDAVTGRRDGETASKGAHSTQHPGHEANYDRGCGSPHLVSS